MLRKIARWIKKRNEVVLEPVDMSVVGVDLHNHLIPGVDDGSASYEQTKEIIESLQKMGYNKIVTTPHVMIDGYPNTSNGLKKGLDKLKGNLKEDNIQVDIDIAAEYYFDSHLMALNEIGDLLTIGDNYVLIEFSYMNKPLNLEHGISEIKAKGYKVIIAHPERYTFFQGNLEAYRYLRNLGVLFQMNLMSLSNLYGPGAMMTARMLIDEEMVDLVGTDIHNPGQLRFVEKARRDKYFHQLVQSGRIMNQKIF